MSCRWNIISVVCLINVLQFDYVRAKAVAQEGNSLLEGEKACFINSTVDPAFITANKGRCPQKTCQRNDDCWVSYGSTEACVCDSQLCGAVCVVDTKRCSLIAVARRVKTITYTMGGKPATSPDKLNIGAMAEFVCEDNFYLKGSRYLYCLATFTWSGQPPECSERTDVCESPPQILNSMVDPTYQRLDYLNGDKIKFICREGFKDARRTESFGHCVNNKWDYDPLNCEPIECPDPVWPENGMGFMNGRKYGTKATEFCNDGYRIICADGSNNKEKCFRECQKDATWSSGPAKCIKITCPLPKEPVNGKRIGTNNAVNNVMTFECNQGFELAGSRIRRCQLNGQWDGEDAVCNLRSCGQPPKVEFAKINFTSTFYNSKATYSCPPEYTLEGKSATLMCQETEGQSAWLPQPPPRCLLQCPMMELDNALLKINEGMKAATKNVTAKGPKFVPHGFSVNVNCSSGFELENRSMPICQNGTWSNLPKCVPANCASPPPRVEHAMARFDNQKHGSTARYVCYSGHQLANTKESFYKCEYGNWHGKTPICNVVRCYKPASPEGGSILLHGHDTKVQFDSPNTPAMHNQMLEYTCPPEHRLMDGPRYAVCVNGKWSPPEIPRCMRVMHDPLPLSWLFFKDSDTFDDEE